MANVQFERILIVKNRALGDSIFGLSVFAYLKSKFPNAHLTYALPSWIVPLYQKVESDVDSFLPMNLKTLGGQFNFLKAIRKGKFDLVIELHDNPRSHRLLEIARFFFGIKLFHHNHHLSYIEKTGIHDQGIRKAISQRDLDGAFSCLRFFNSNETVPHYLENLPKLNVKSGEKYNSGVVLGIVATRDEKKWPIQHYADLVNIIKDKYSDTKIIVPISPSEEDQKLSKELVELVGKKVEIIQKPLSDLPIEMSKAQLYVGNDTGLKHICAALGLKTVTIFGPEEPLEWHPYDKKDHTYFWIYGTDIRSGMHDVCLLRQFDRTNSIEEINPLDVFSAISHHLN
jgi:ADP-heptose:LPS heptosyltransferase